LNLHIRSLAGNFFSYQHQHQRAESELLSVLEFDPSRALAHYRLAELYMSMEKYDEGVMELKKVFSLLGHDDGAAVLERSYAELGFAGAMRRLAEWGVENSVPAPWEHHNIARFYTRAGEYDEAIQWLERSYEEHEVEMVWLNVAPRWDPLRADRRFQDLVRRMNFPE